MRKTFFRIAMLMLVVAFLASCAGGSLIVRPGSAPIDPAKDKFLIMPVTIHGLPGDNLKQQAALFAGFLAAFRDRGVSLQPLEPVLQKAGLGDLSWKLAHGIHHMVDFHRSFDFREDAGFHGGNTEYLIAIEGTGKLVEFASKQLNLNFKPKYVVIAHIDKTGQDPLGKSITYRVLAGIYNLEAKKVDEAIYYEQRTINDDKAILVEMGTLGAKLYGLLFAQKEVSKS